jgi:glycine dehydrogenase
MSQLPSLSQLQDPNVFLRRHLGPNAREQQAMLETLGVTSRTELIEQTVPPAIRRRRRWPACTW